MASAAQVLPPPGGSSSAGGQGAGGGFPSAAGPRSSPMAVQALDMVQNIVSSARTLSEMNPKVAPVARQILDLCQQLQQAMVESAPPDEGQAPPS